MQAFTTVDEYISSFPPATQKLLKQIRATIKKAGPDAEEIISYGMPAYKQNGVLVYFGGFKSHIGLYPTASGVRNFQHELSPYKSSKGAIQFPIDQPMPLDLIKKIVTSRIEENLQKLAAKKVAKTCPAGHKYYKTSDCPTCPICEQKRKPADGFLSTLSAPARRALEGKGITSAKQLAKHTEADILKLHGMGPASLPKLRTALAAEGLSFKKM